MDPEAKTGPIQPGLASNETPEPSSTAVGSFRQADTRFGWCTTTVATGRGHLMVRRSRPASRRHDTLVRQYLHARGFGSSLERTFRDAYWLASVSNSLSGALY